MEGQTDRASRMAVAGTQDPFGQLPYIEVSGHPVALAQTYAIARYLARQYGLAGRDAWEQAQVDALADYAAGEQLKSNRSWANRSTRRFSPVAHGVSVPDRRRAPLGENSPVKFVCLVAEWFRSSFVITMLPCSDAGQGYSACIQEYMAKDDNNSAAMAVEFCTFISIKPFLEVFERTLRENKHGPTYLVGCRPTWADFVVTILLDRSLNTRKTLLDSYPLLKDFRERIRKLKGIKEWLAQRPPTPF